MPILIVNNAGGIGFYDVGDLDPRPIEKLLPKLAGNFRVKGHVVAGNWFGIEPYGLVDLFDVPESHLIDPYLEAPKDLRLAILEAWTQKVRDLPPGVEKTKYQARLDKVSVLMRTGKPDRFTLIDDW